MLRTPAVAAAEIFGDAFHYGCVDPATGKTEASTLEVADEFGCGDRSCPAQFSECKVGLGGRTVVPLSTECMPLGFSPTR